MVLILTFGVVLLMTAAVSGLAARTVLSTHWSSWSPAPWSGRGSWG